MVGRIELAKTKYGELNYYSDDYYVGRSLRTYGEYSERETELFRAILKPGDVVIDAGANIGALSLALADIVGTEGCVHAFEPQPENFSLLKANAEQSRAVVAYGVALGKECGMTCVPSLSHLDHKNYGDVEIGQGHIEVALKTVDSYNFDRMDLIKIDVQGCEAEVLEGARDTIATHKPILYVENDRAEQAEALVDQIREMGYGLWWHIPRLFNEQNFLGNKLNVFGNAASFNMLCIPTDAPLDMAQRADEVTKDLLAVKDISIIPREERRSGWAGIVRLGGVGDNLIAASVFRPLKAKGYKIDIITQEPQCVVFANNPFVDKVSIKRPEDLPRGDMPAWQNWFLSRSHEYDVFANLSHSCEGLMAAFPAMTSFYWPKAAREKIMGRSYLEVVHDIVGVPYDFGPMFFPTDAEKEQAQDTRAKLKGKKIVGWCLTGTRVDKIYPQTPMAVARLIRELDVGVVMMGAPPPSTDYELSKQVHEHVKQQNGTEDGLYQAITTKIGEWPIRRILTFAATCDLVIGPDTGPMWSVAFEDVPKIMLHSHASAENITKHWLNTKSLVNNVHCWPCHLLHDQIESCQEEQRRCGVTVDMEAKGAACISGISVEDIVANAKAALGV